MAICTQDTKLCPDGVTYVGRSGDACAFDACPAPIASGIPGWTNPNAAAPAPSTGGYISQATGFLESSYPVAGYNVPVWGIALAAALLLFGRGR